MSKVGGAERGDTLVEVLIAVGILGVVLSSVAVVINRSIKTNLASQERLSALRVAERQQELFKAGVSDRSLIDRPASDVFCMIVDGARAVAVTDTDSRCRVDALGNATTDAPNYKIAMTVDDPSTQGVAGLSGVAGGRLKVHVSWQSVMGGNDESVDTYSEVYLGGS